MSKLGVKVLLVGPMDKKHAEDEFSRAELQLTLEGYEVFNPMKMPKQKGWGFIEELTWMLQVLEGCDEVLLIKGSYTELINEEGKTLAFQWHSDDAQIIYLVAKRYGIDVLSEELTGEGGHTQ